MVNKASWDCLMYAYCTKYRRTPTWLILQTNSDPYCTLKAIISILSPNFQWKIPCKYRYSETSACGDCLELSYFCWCWWDPHSWVFPCQHGLYLTPLYYSIVNMRKYFRYRRWGSSLPCPRTRDPPLSPQSALAEIFRHTCLQSRFHQIYQFSG